ncbi:MAG: hypothetical protein ACI8W8_002918 [Rhodothermales bacterium]|jgi:hypothetical protein
MLTQPTIDKLHSLRLHAMADALGEQRQDARITELSLEDRFGLLVDRLYQQNQDRAFINRLRYAGLSPGGPCIDSIDYRHPRGLNRSPFEVLTTPRMDHPWAQRADNRSHRLGQEPPGCRHRSLGLSPQLSGHLPALPPSFFAR